MSARIGDLFVIEREPPRACARCGCIRETRDINGAGLHVCAPCATPAEVRQYMDRVFDGATGFLDLRGSRRGES